MFFQKILFSWTLLLFIFQSLSAVPLLEQLKQEGYLEIREIIHENSAFDSLYDYFDECVAYLQKHPKWFQKLYIAKERFIRTQDRNNYSSDFFGLYDESEREERRQISFYYSIHFHEFICTHFPEFSQVSPINNFLEACREIHQPYVNVFIDVATKLDLDTIFLPLNQPPVLLKVIKYLPSYVATRPHYDGTAFSLFVHGTDDRSLLFSPYKSSFSQHDFSFPIKGFSDPKSLVIIPGALLTEFFIYPTPHIVAESGTTRYATIAFAMRPNYTPQKFEFPLLPNFKD